MSKLLSGKKNKTLLGIDIGQNRVKLALVSGGVVKRTAAAEMPENSMKEGRPEPPDMIADLIRETMRDAGIHAANAAFCISGENIYIKHIEMPMMSQDQLKKNLPYEFNDFIDGDPNNFVFDYITVEGGDELPPPEDEEEEAVERLNLLGVASPKEYLDVIKGMLKKAGLKLTVAAPELSAYASLIRAHGAETDVPGGEFCFVDLGYGRIRLYMFKEDTFMTSRELEWGISDVVACIADETGTELFTARSYLETNFEDCQDLESVRNRFDLIATELKRSLDFYRFSNPDSQLRDIWIAGGGSYIRPLIDEIVMQLDDIMIHSTDELLPELEGDEMRNLFLQAAGIAMNQ